ncbi:hypothetical protein [Methanosarcina horonobensis]|uniref:hypothetical protein n=1 Tax=Methanosarcina horonobensis TaxID=418008 RepID=UPI000AAA5D82|nr:hypothetical protein [Methanosarcina horonobensis]
MSGRRKRIEIRECDIPNVQVRVLSNDFRPVGDYSLQNFFKKIQEGIMIVIILIERPAYESIKDVPHNPKYQCIKTPKFYSPNYLKGV